MMPLPIGVFVFKDQQEQQRELQQNMLSNSSSSLLAFFIGILHKI